MLVLVLVVVVVVVVLVMLEVFAPGPNNSLGSERMVTRIYSSSELLIEIS